MDVKAVSWTTWEWLEIASVTGRFDHDRHWRRHLTSAGTAQVARRLQIVHHAIQARVAAQKQLYHKIRECRFLSSSDQTRRMPAVSLGVAAFGFKTMLRLDFSFSFYSSRTLRKLSAKRVMTVTDPPYWLS